ncbi:Do family serine endopeptidase [Robiginitomaculum antarcticum]|uniref:Do family serine endopeptidase n=1 Tax=Robiginitomaculum antarcticum TaxID=437507 RepID=UPI000374F821|nr:Do family serine endopeptidase [Robiginitomaculum antarcticum]
MKTYLVSAAFTALSLSLVPQIAHAQMAMDAKRGVVTMAPTVERTVPAVVSIRVTSRKSSGTTAMMLPPQLRDMLPEGLLEQQPRQRDAVSAGSGVIVDARKGHILTNHHVIDGAKDIAITLHDGRQFDAEIIGSDDKTDLALIKIDAKDLKAITFADAKNVKVGDYAIAIGNPFGVGLTVTTGIVSGMERYSGSRDKYENFIQTDASINPGNSGGALVNSKGELIGINSSIISRSGTSSGVGFAVPVDMAQNVMAQLLEYGEVRRGRIGVVIQDVTPGLAKALDLKVKKGALIAEVAEGSPADLAGLKAGDVVTTFDGEAIESSRDLRNAVGFVPLGKTSKLSYNRDGKTRKTSIGVEAITEDDLPVDNDAMEDIPEPGTAKFRGATVMNIPGEISPSGGNDGVVISNVERTSAADEAGLRRGDIVREINRREITDVDDFSTLIDGKSGVVALTVQRGRSQIFVAIE